MNTQITKRARHTGGLPTTTTSERIENVVQVVILIAVGVMAGAASFTHVHDWTMNNSPAGTDDWFGWANAVISELTPIAAGLEARRRTRNNQPITYPIALLIASVALSLAAQFAVAKPGISGWLLSAVPALAFMALVKLVITRTPATAQPTQLAIPADVHEASTHTSRETPRSDHESATATPVAVPVEPAPQASAVDVSADLAMSAQMVAFTHRQSTGQPITLETLAERLGVNQSTARQLLHHLGHPTVTEPRPPARINGHNPAEAVTR